MDNLPQVTLQTVNEFRRGLRGILSADPQLWEQQFITFLGLNPYLAQYIWKTAWGTDYPHVPADMTQEETNARSRAFSTGFGVAILISRSLP
jgi:hypothetical protein